MPTPKGLTPVEILFSGPYYPILPATAPGALVGSIRRGSNVWRDPGGKTRVAKGLMQTSSTNVGARIFASDIQRAVIAGGLDGTRLPFAGFLRYENACLYFLSEETSAQVYLDETAATGVVTASESGRLRVSIPDGGGGYDTFDAGFEAPALPNGTDAIGTGSLPTGRVKMEGFIGIAAARWRIATNAIGPICSPTYVDLPPSLTGNSLQFRFDLAGNEPIAGQDGYVLAGSRWNDQSGEMHIVRFVRVDPPGTFAATNGSANIVGTGTQWLRDLRNGDTAEFDGGPGGDIIANVTSDTTATLLSPWGGSTSGGHTIEIIRAAESWADGDLGEIVFRDIIAPPPAAGVTQYAGRVLVWGCFGGDDNPTGPVLLPMLDDNPEHCFIRGIHTDSGGDLINVLGADGPLYLMTTRGLEIVTVTNDPLAPYNIRQIVTPGFKATTNGILFGDYFYGFNGRPFRTRASQNIDLEFAAEVKSDMEAWDPQRVIIEGDPKNQAVLYIYDDTSSTTVIPFMAEQEQWNPPIFFSGRFMDAAMVDGDLYITVLSGGNTRVNRWEGGTGIGGTRFTSSQFYDPNFLKSNRLKYLDIVGKCGSLSVYAVTSDADPPDVGDLGEAAATFTLGDTSKKEPQIRTNIRGDAYAFRVDFTSNDGYLDKIVANGIPRGESR